MSTRISSQFQSAIQDGPWTTVAVWDRDDPFGILGGKIFEIGEPVRLKTVVIPVHRNISEGKAAIWWIAGFTDANGHFARVVRTWAATKIAREEGGVAVSVGELEKLPDMLRITAEAFR
jgi:hypothetical protein